jgi:hypothetical protein
VSPPDKVRDPYDQLCWLCNPVCLEGRDEAQDGPRLVPDARGWAVLSASLLLAALTTF